jgi:hypothetical protein
MCNLRFPWRKKGSYGFLGSWNVCAQWKMEVFELYIFYLIIVQYLLLSHVLGVSILLLLYVRWQRVEAVL